MYTFNRVTHQTPESVELELTLDDGRLIGLQQATLRALIKSVKESNKYFPPPFLRGG